MYLPRNFPLCEPHIFTWVGASGRRYEFAVSRPVTSWLDEAAVFLLVKREGAQTKVLHIGHTRSLHQRFGHASERCPEIWRRALAAGMTHVHLRFEACSERERRAEVNDLKAALRPSIEDTFRREEERPATTPAAPEPGSRSVGEVLVPYRARLKPTRTRDPHVDIEAFDAHAQRGDLPIHAFEAPRALRADPAREVSFDEEVSFGERDTTSEATVLDDVPLLDGAPASMAVLSEHRPTIEPAQAPWTQPVTASRPEEAAGPVEVEVPVTPIAEHVSKTTVDAEALPSRSHPFSGAGQRGAGFFSRLMRLVAERGARWLGTFGGSHKVAVPTPEASHGSGLPPRDERTAPSAVDERQEPAVADVGPRAEPDTADPEVAMLFDEIARRLDVPAIPASGDVAVLVPAPTVSTDHDGKNPSIADSGDSQSGGSAAPGPSEAPGVSEITRELTEAVKRSLDLDPSAPLVLFAGAVSYEAGADILADAIVTVCGGDASAQFVFAGEGALRGELQDRMVCAGVGNRCRFIGDVPSGRFEQLLKACDFVVIPARVEQGEELAGLALSFGRPALVTHQSGIRCIVHGENGLITYDNPGSFVWGIREMLGPLYGKLGRRHAEAA